MTNKEAKEKLYIEWQKFLEDNIDYAGISEAFKMAFKALDQEPCEDCISRKIVLDRIKEVCFSREQEWVDFRVSQGSNGQRDLIINFIEDLPSSQPKTGHWILHNEGYFDESYVCSKCDGDSPFDYKFCPNCGARMVEPQERSNKE